MSLTALFPAALWLLVTGTRPPFLAPISSGSVRWRA